MALNEDQITDEEVAAISTVLTPANVQKLRNKDDAGLEDAIQEVESLLSTQAPLKSAVKVYKALDGGEILQGAGDVIDNSFFAASTTKPSGDFVISMSIPAGEKVIELDGGAVITKRGFKFRIPAESQDAQALGLLADACVSCGMSTLHEFFNRCHADGSGRFCGKKGGGNAAKGVGQAPLTGQDREKRLQEREKRLQKQAKTERKAERRRKINTVIQVVATVATVVGLGIATGVLTPSDMQNARNKASRKMGDAKKSAQHRKNAKDIRKKFGDN